MVGAVSNAAGQLVGLHRTYLTTGGRKADVEVVKKLTAVSARLAGCTIKLFEPDYIKGALTLGVAEGIDGLVRHSGVVIRARTRQIAARRIQPN